jgi:hypothetical protein
VAQDECTASLEEEFQSSDPQWPQVATIVRAHNMYVRTEAEENKAASPLYGAPARTVRPPARFQKKPEKYTRRISEQLNSARQFMEDGRSRNC